MSSKKIVSLAEKFINKLAQLSDNDKTPVLGLVTTQVAPKDLNRKSPIFFDEPEEKYIPLSYKLGQLLAKLYGFIGLDYDILKHNGFKLKTPSGEVIKQNVYALKTFNKLADKVLECKQMPRHEVLTAARKFVLFMYEMERELDQAEKVFNNFFIEILHRGAPAKTFAYAREVWIELESELSEVTNVRQTSRG